MLPYINQAFNLLMKNMIMKKKFLFRIRLISGYQAIISVIFKISKLIFLAVKNHE